MKITESAILAMKENFICDSCLGRIYSGLLSGLTNEQRGKTIREFVAFLIDSGEKIDVDFSNFYGIKFRNVKIKPEKPKKCKLCKNFFREEINRIVARIVKQLSRIEFDSFLVGSVPTDEMLNVEEKLWSEIGIEFVESVRSEINREVGKRVEKLTRKDFSLKNPDITIVVDLKNKRITTEIRSLYILGGYQKLSKGIPQSKWVCMRCGGRGCSYCKGKGQLYPTSVQEIIEKPLLKATKGGQSKFSGCGREDIDARCLDYRPFVIELKEPMKRKIDLRRIEKEINKSKKVKVKKLRFTTKDTIDVLKSAKIDKTYVAIVDFEKLIDKTKVKELKSLKTAQIMQKTPLRVVHRRADRLRKRLVKNVSWKLINKKRLQLKITGESGLYVKELITGDEGRTQPNIAELLNNKVKKISLDVVKIHTKQMKM